MLRSLTLALLLAAPALVLAQDKKPEAGDKAEKFDAAKLVGDWKITDGSKAGEKPSDGLDKDVVKITKDKISLKSQGMDFAFTYKIDDKKDPAAIDLEITEPEALKGAKALGIVKMAGDKLTLIYNPMMGGARPTKFESTKDNGFYLFVHTKVKADKK